MKHDETTIKEITMKKKMTFMNAVDHLDNLHKGFHLGNMNKARITIIELIECIDDPMKSAGILENAVKHNGLDGLQLTAIVLTEIAVKKAAAEFAHGNSVFLPKVMVYTLDGPNDSGNTVSP